MKQMEETFKRYFDGKDPLKSKKWKAFDVKSDKGFTILVLYHYHHLVLAVDIKERKIIKEWWELPTDKRGLDSAKKILEREGYI